MSARTAIPRPRTRRRARRARTHAGTSSARSSPTRRPGSRRTPTSSTRSTRPGSRTGSTPAPTPRPTVDCLVQVSLDPEAPAPGGRCPAGRRRGGRGCDRLRGGLRLRGVMGVAPLGGDAARRTAPLVEVSAAAARAATPTRRGLGGDERRLRGGDRSRRDTRACRQRGTRSATLARVMSETIGATGFSVAPVTRTPSQRRQRGHGGLNAQGRGLPGPARGHRPLRG